MIYCHHCWYALPAASLCLHLSGQPAWMNISRCIFSMLRNSTTPLGFTCASMSDSVLWDCPSAANCLMATKCNGILARKFILYCHATNIRLHNKVGGITFRAELIELLFIYNHTGNEWFYHVKLVIESIWLFREFSEIIFNYKHFLCLWPYYKWQQYSFTPMTLPSKGLKSLLLCKVALF